MVRTLLGALCALLVLASAARASWTPPALLSGCPPAPVGSAATPLIVYPSSEPRVRSGAGALLWSATGRCTAGAPEVFGAPLGAGGLPGAGRAVIGRGGSAAPSGGSATSPGGAANRESGLTAVSTAVGTAAGQVLALGSAPGGSGAFVEGGLPGALSAPRPLGGPAEPVAAVSGYLGDAVVVSIEKSPPRARGALTNPPRTRARAAGSANDIPKPAPWALEVRVQRHYSAAPSSPLLLPVGSAAPVALTVATDFRSDLLLVWAAQDAIYARELTQGGVAEPVRRLAGVVGVPELRALYSDDGRAIVAWREQRGTSTSIQLAISDAALRFGAPRVVERFRDLPRLAPPPGSLRLVRLSSEAVMMAWTGMRAGRYVVRASPVSLRRGVWAPVVVSAPPVPPGPGGSSSAVRPPGPGDQAWPTQALLADLVPGPRADALALWTAAPLTRGGELDESRRAIVAAWGHYGGRGEARFASPEAVGAPGPNGTPAVAFDPQNDRALAAWVTGSRSPRIAYAQRSAGAPQAGAASLATVRAYRPAAAARRIGTSRAGEHGIRPAGRIGTSRAGEHGIRLVWLSALGLLLIAVAGAVRQLSARRRGVRGLRGPARWEGRVRVPRDRARRPRSRRH